MKFYRTGSVWGCMARLLAIFCMVCSWSAEATAPRITSQLFGEEKKADIVGYQFAPLEAGIKSDSELAVRIVTEAFSAVGKTPVVDVLPSKQLATYALFSHEAVALMGSQQDLVAKEKNQYHVVTFYLRGITPNEEPISLIFSKKNPHGDELHRAFNEGLQKILKSGKYLEILEEHHGKGHVPTDYASRLKQYNPDWK